MMKTHRRRGTLPSSMASALFWGLFDATIGGESGRKIPETNHKPI